MKKIKSSLEAHMGDSPRFHKQIEERVLVELSNNEKNRSMKKIRWQYPMVLTSFAVVMIVLISTLFWQTDDSPATLPEEKVSPVYEVPDIPIISQLKGTQFTFENKDGGMSRGNNEYMEYPLVIDPSMYENKPIERGDVILYKEEGDNEKPWIQGVARIIGLPGETVEVINGELYVNNQPLQTFYGSVQRQGIDTEEQYIELLQKAAYYNGIEAEDFKRMNVERITVSDEEILIVGDDWLRSPIRHIHVNNIEGKVLGYFQPEWSFTLTAEEQSIYNAFTSDFDLEYLREADPITVAKLYVQSKLDGNAEAEYALYTDREEWVQWSLQEHLEMSNDDSLTNEDKQNLMLFDKIGEGIFIHTEENRGYIKFYSMVNDRQEPFGFQMVQNEDGIWQVGFMPIQ